MMDREREAAPQRNGQIEGLRIGVLVDGALQWRQIVSISSAPGDGVTTDPRVMYTRITPQSYHWERLRQVDGNNGWVIETDPRHPMAPPRPGLDKEVVERLARQAGLSDVFSDGEFWQSENCPSVKRDDLGRFATLVAMECGAAFIRAAHKG